MHRSEHFYLVIGAGAAVLFCAGVAGQRGLKVQGATYKYSVDTFAKMLSIDRRDIINDDLTLFDDTARSLGRSAMRSLSDLVYKVLLANAGSFFSGGNGNYDAGAGTAVSSASLAAGIARMMPQRDDEKRDLDIRHRTLLVPPELQQSAKELLLSDFIQRANNDVPTGNALKNALDLEIEPRLSNSDRFTGTSAKAWYLFASPADAAKRQALHCATGSGPTATCQADGIGGGGLHHPAVRAHAGGNFGACRQRA